MKLSHKIVRSRLAKLNRTQEAVAEALGISDRHVRNLCTKDTNAYIALCYALSRFLDTSIEELLVTGEETPGD